MIKQKTTTKWYIFNIPRVRYCVQYFNSSILQYQTNKIYSII